MTDITPSVWLRAIEPEDLDLIYQLENDITLWDVSGTSVHYSRNVISDFIARFTGDIYTDKQARMIAENQFGEPVAIADLVDFNPHNRRAELGVVVLPLSRGAGYGRAVVERLVDYARDTLHLHQLYVYVSEDNRASLNLFRSVGFQETGRLKSWIFNGTGYKDVLLLQLFL